MTEEPFASCAAVTPSCCVATNATSSAAASCATYTSVVSVAGRLYVKSIGRDTCAACPHDASIAAPLGAAVSTGTSNVSPLIAAADAAVRRHDMNQSVAHRAHARRAMFVSGGTSGGLWHILCD